MNVSSRSRGEPFDPTPNADKSAGARRPVEGHPELGIRRMRTTARGATISRDNHETRRSTMATTVQQAPGLWRTDLQEHDLGVAGRQVIQNRVEIGPDAPYVRHTHPGEEIIYVLEGTLQYDIDGQSPITAGAGEALTVPAETPHAVRNVGTGNAVELATYVVEKGKPFLVLVD